MSIDVRVLRGLLITLFNLVTVVLSLAFAFWLRFEFTLTWVEGTLLMTGLMVAVPVKMVVFLAGGSHKSSWRYAGLTDLSRLFLVNLAASVSFASGTMLWVGPEFPRSVYVIDFLLCFLLGAGARFSSRLYNEILKAEVAPPGKEVLIYGAGAAGRTLVREIRANPGLGFHVIGFVDDDLSLRSGRIMDVPVVCTGRGISAIVDRHRSRGSGIDEIIIAMPSASGRQMREAHANCRASGVPCKTIPGVGDLLTGNYLSAQLRNISLEDLLGREQVRLEEKRIYERIVGRTILITGAAGSIGSELCRQTARFRPGKLVALDQAESDLFKIDQELRQSYPDLEIVPVIGDIRDLRSIDEIVRIHSIDSIYHAAAYKHVPIMELHVVEAVRNNIIGTWNLVQVACRHGVSEFLMISSDKAVNPTSVMGATKRIAELIVSTLSEGGRVGTNFVSVRFGNVLESNGSVVPIFRSQIAAGGPVTVTDREVRRYFMSIREAVLLSLQASTMGKGSEIFVLEMGEPVRILDLAHNMIRLAGLVPDEDIEVRITGLRPGEKLVEEIASSEEDIIPTEHDKIHVFRGSSLGVDVLEDWLLELHALIEVRDPVKIRRHLVTLVPEFKSDRLQESPKRETVRIARPQSGSNVSART